MVMSNDAMRDAVQALFQPWPKDEMGPSDEPESQYRFGYNTALEDVLEALAAPAQSEAKPAVWIERCDLELMLESPSSCACIVQAKQGDPSLDQVPLYTAPSTAPAQSVDGYKDLYVALHKTLGPAIDYVQSHQSEFGIGIGEDTIPHIVKAFLDSRAPAGDGGDNLRDALRAMIEDVEATYKAAAKGKPLLIELGQLFRLRRAKDALAHHAPTGADAPANNGGMGASDRNAIIDECILAMHRAPRRNSAQTDFIIGAEKNMQLLKVTK